MCCKLRCGRASVERIMSSSTTKHGGYLKKKEEATLVKRDQAKICEAFHLPGALASCCYYYDHYVISWRAYDITSFRLSRIYTHVPPPPLCRSLTHWNTPKNLNDRFSPHTHTHTHTQAHSANQLVNQVSWVGQQSLLLCGGLYGYIYIGLVAPTSSCDQAKRLSFPTCRVLRRWLALVRKSNK